MNKINSLPELHFYPRAIGLTHTEASSAAHGVSDVVGAVRGGRATQERMGSVGDSAVVSIRPLQGVPANPLFSSLTVICDECRLFILLGQVFWDTLMRLFVVQLNA